MAAGKVAEKLGPSNRATRWPLHDLCGAVQSDERPYFVPHRELLPRRAGDMRASSSSRQTEGSPP
jgi:hypothetical protein